MEGEGAIGGDVVDINQLIQIINSQNEINKKLETKLTEASAALELMRISGSRLPPNPNPNSLVPTLKKEHMEMIPVFTGNPEALSNFLNITKQLHDRFYNPRDREDFQNVMVFNAIKTKVHPPASDILFSANVTDYNQLRNALIAAYQDKRDLFTLNIDLSKLRQGDQEDPFRFHHRVRDVLNKIIAYIKIHETTNARGMINHYEALALRCFLLHLKEPLGSILRTRQPADLNTALGWMTNDYQLLTVVNQRPKTNSGPLQKPNPSRFVPTYHPRPNHSFPPRNFPPFPQSPNSRPGVVQNSGNQTSQNPPQKFQQNYQKPAQQNYQKPVHSSNAQKTWTPMSWQTTHPNFHNINTQEAEISDYENVGEHSEYQEYPECYNEIETWQNPDQFEDDQATENEVPFLGVPSLETPTI